MSEDENQLGGPVAADVAEGYVRKEVNLQLKRR